MSLKTHEFKMKILIISSQTPENSSTFIKHQFEYLASNHILHSGFRPHIYAGSTIFKFPLNINILRASIKRVLPALYSTLYTKALTSFLNTNKFDVVLGNYGTQASNIARACYNSKVPLVAHFHGYDAYIHSILHEYKSRYSYLFQTASKIIAVSNDMAEQLKSLGAPGDKIVINPYGVNNKLFTQCNPAANKNILIFVGRFTAKKAPDLLLKAFHKATLKFPDAILIMVGQGELTQLVNECVSSLKLENNVKVMAWQPPELVAAEMQSARAYVQHSKFAENGDGEGTPNSILEASCSGLPVISTRHAGIKEAVIHEKTGYLVDEGDWEAMGEYMIKLLSDPVLASEMGDAARAHVLKNYDINKQMDKLLSILTLR